MDFTGLNEAGVREEVIAPLLRELGYQSNTEHHVTREWPLRYPYIYLGRKSRKKDQLLCGRADYVLEAGRRVPWVIEAKAATQTISTDDIEQAYSYANHPEVRAVYFALCNGHELQVFQTNQGPTTVPLLRSTYDEWQTEVGLIQLKSLLSPSSVLRNNPPHVLDLGLPLGPSLRSTCQIFGGSIEYDSVLPDLPAIRETAIPIIGGSIERTDDGDLLIAIESRSSIKSIDAFLKECKLTVFEAKSADKTLSTDPHVPTVFRSKANTIFPGGSRMIDPGTWREVVLPRNIFVEVDFEAHVVLSEGTIAGTARLFALWDRQPLLRAVGRITIQLSRS